MRLLKRLRWRIGFLRVSRLMVRTGRPPETRATYQRLRAAGTPAWHAYRLLAAAYEAETASMLREQRVHDHARYVAELNALPRLPVSSLNTSGI